MGVERPLSFEDRRGPTKYFRVPHDSPTYLSTTSDLPLVDGGRDDLCSERGGRVGDRPWGVGRTVVPVRSR